MDHRIMYTFLDAYDQNYKINSSSGGGGLWAGPTLSVFISSPGSFPRVKKKHPLGSPRSFDNQLVTSGLAVAPSSSGSDPGLACSSGFLSCVFTLERDRFRWEKWSVIDVCLWLVLEAVVAAPAVAEAVVVVEALDAEEEGTPGGAGG